MFRASLFHRRFQVLQVCSLRTNVVQHNTQRFRGVRELRTPNTKSGDYTALIIQRYEWWQRWQVRVIHHHYVVRVLLKQRMNLVCRWLPRTFSPLSIRITLSIICTIFNRQSCSRKRAVEKEDNTFTPAGNALLFVLLCSYLYRPGQGGWLSYTVENNGVSLLSLADPCCCHFDTVCCCNTAAVQFDRVGEGGTAAVQQKPVFTTYATRVSVLFCTRLQQEYTILRMSAAPCLCHQRSPALYFQVMRDLAASGPLTLPPRTTTTAGRHGARRPVSACLYLPPLPTAKSAPEMPQGGAPVCDKQHQQQQQQPATSAYNLPGRTWTSGLRLTLCLTCTASVVPVTRTQGHCCQYRII